MAATIAHLGLGAVAVHLQGPSAHACEDTVAAEPLDLDSAMCLVSRGRDPETLHILERFGAFCAEAWGKEEERTSRTRWEDERGTACIRHAGNAWPSQPIHVSGMRCMVPTSASRLRRTQPSLDQKGVVQPMTNEQSTRVCTPIARIQQPDGTYDDHIRKSCSNSYLMDTTASVDYPSRLISDAACMRSRHYSYDGVHTRCMRGCKRRMRNIQGAQRGLGELGDYNCSSRSRCCGCTSPRSSRSCL